MKQIVVCGSMKFKDDIYELRDRLIELGYDALAPIDVEIKDETEKAKRALDHLNKIGDDKTDAIIVLNKEKNNIPNYIGLNALSEIAVAFYKRKRIFLLNNIYEHYRDELIEWGCIPLKGNLEKIKEYQDK